MTLLEFDRHRDSIEWTTLDIKNKDNTSVSAKKKKVKVISVQQAYQSAYINIYIILNFIFFNCFQ